jgi:hypothetical protein
MIFYLGCKRAHVLEGSRSPHPTIWRRRRNHPWSNSSFSKAFLSRFAQRLRAAIASGMSRRRSAGSLISVPPRQTLDRECAAISPPGSLSRLPRLRLCRRRSRKPAHCARHTWPRHAKPLLCSPSAILGGPPLTSFSYTSPTLARTKASNMGTPFTFTPDDSHPRLAVSDGQHCQPYSNILGASIVHGWWWDFELTKPYQPDHKPLAASKYRPARSTL